MMRYRSLRVEKLDMLATQVFSIGIRVYTISIVVIKNRVMQSNVSKAQEVIF